VITLSHTNHVVFVMETQCSVIAVATVVVLWVLAFWTANCIVVPHLISMFQRKIVPSFSKVAKFETY